MKSKGTVTVTAHVSPAGAGLAFVSYEIEGLPSSHGQPVGGVSPRYAGLEVRDGDRFKITFERIEAVTR